jgi:uncharacterized protein (DUF952 family)
MSESVPSTVYHLCTRPALDAASSAGAYRADSLEREGFIHLSQAHQVLPTARNYFRGVADVLVLTIDTTRLTAPLRYEAPASLATTDGSPPVHVGELYPHCYGPINLDAIVDVVPLDSVNR